MRKTFCVLAALTALAATPALHAQGPGPGRGPGHGPSVDFLLARTGTLQLTDQQVVKLAAIARRAADRHKAMRASFDSLRKQFRGGGDSAARARRRMGPPPEFMQAMQKEREAAHTDLRDAIAVLTPDQQAHAWEMISARRMRMHGGPRRGGPPGPMRFRAGPGHDGQRSGTMRRAPGFGDDDSVQPPDGDEPGTVDDSQF
jgi:hypothetical protein